MGREREEVQALSFTKLTTHSPSETNIRLRGPACRQAGVNHETNLSEGGQEVPLARLMVSD